MQPHEVYGLLKFSSQSGHLPSDATNVHPSESIDFAGRRSFIRNGGIALGLIALSNAVPWFATSVLAATDAEAVRSNALSSAAESESDQPAPQEREPRVEVTRDEFSPHYLVRRGSPTGEWAPLPNSIGVVAIETHQGKATIKLQDDAGTNYWLDPLGLATHYAGESPLQRLRRLVDAYAVPAPGLDLTNRDLLHSITFRLASDRTDTATGYLYEVTPNGEAIVRLPSRLGTNVFEVISDQGLPVTLYPQLVSVPASLINGIDLEDRVHSQADEGVDSSQLAEPVKLSERQQLQKRQEQFVALVRPQSPNHSPSTEWSVQLGYSLQYEALRKSTMAQTFDDLLRFSEETGAGGWLLGDIINNLYPETQNSINSISARNSFVINGVCYITGANQNGIDVIVKIEGDTITPLVTLTEQNQNNRRIIGAFPLPQQPDRYWVISFLQQSNGINDSLDLLDLQSSPPRFRKLHFPVIPGYRRYDLYVTNPKLRLTSTGQVMVTRYGFGEDPIPDRDDEGGGEWIVDTEELLRLASTGGSGDIEVPAERITAINHSFGLVVPSGAYGQRLNTMGNPLPLVDNEVWLPIAMSNFVSGSVSRFFRTLCWHKNNVVDEFDVQDPTNGLAPQSQVGITTGWNPHHDRTTIRDGVAHLLAYTYPRTENTPFFGVIAVRQIGNGSFELVPEANLD